MLIINELLSSSAETSVVLGLTFEARQKNRLRTTLSDGTDILLTLPTGTLLRNGDILKAIDGTIVLIQAASEHVTTVYIQDSVLLARACYHLGLQHIIVQIGTNWLRYQNHELGDKIIQRLGLTLLHEDAPFEPDILS